MTDRKVDVVLSVAGLGNGEQRGDRPALDDLEVPVDQAPFDVLGVAEVRFDNAGPAVPGVRPGRRSVPAADNPVEHHFVRSA